MKREKVFIVVVDYELTEGWTAEDVAGEMTELVLACQGEVIDVMVCRIDKPTAAYFVGTGKAQEIAERCGAIQVDSVVFSYDLKASQQRNLEEVLKVKTIDRTQLILDIFARRAKSMEGKMQVELAQLEYLAPRLIGKGIVLSNQGGGIGTSGPGETKLEVDRRRIALRIDRLRKDLKDVSADRAVKRKKRKELGIPAVSLVGYTNAGKSTLLNTLTQADQVTKDGLFTTLDSLSRQFVLPNHQQVVLSDTVGFMHQLPHHLIEAFKATLEEVQEADLLLHVVDVSHPNFRNLYESVLAVLSDLGVAEKPMITVLNKIDKLLDSDLLKELNMVIPQSVAISAKTGENLPRLLDRISAELPFGMIELKVVIPIQRMDLINLAHEKGQVYTTQYANDSVSLHVSVPAKIAGLFLKENRNKKK